MTDTVLSDQFMAQTLRDMTKAIQDDKLVPTDDLRREVVETASRTQDAEIAELAVVGFLLAVGRATDTSGAAMSLLDVAKHAYLVAGHSLGEYSALCAVGAFSLADTARLLKTRGQAMQSAVPVGEGGMTALIGADIEQAESVAQEASATGGVCVVANDNAPGQVVISGTMDALARAGEIAKAKGIKRAMPLAVSAPFHSPLMQPAADRMAEELAKVTIRPLSVPVLANVTAKEAANPDHVRQLLIEQVTSRVRWRESIAALRGLTVDTTVEFGGNKVLTGMVKRIDKELANITLDTPADLETFGKGL